MRRKESVCVLVCVCRGRGGHRNPCPEASNEQNAKPSQAFYGGPSQANHACHDFDFLLVQASVEATLALQGPTTPHEKRAHGKIKMGQCPTGRSKPLPLVKSMRIYSIQYTNNLALQLTRMARKTSFLKDWCVWDMCPGLRLVVLGFLSTVRAVAKIWIDLPNLLTNTFPRTHTKPQHAEL